MPLVVRRCWKPIQAAHPTSFFLYEKWQRAKSPCPGLCELSRCNGWISKVFELKSQVWCWLPWVVVFFWCFKYNIIYIYISWMPRFFSRCYPRHNVTLIFLDLLRKSFGASFFVFRIPRLFWIYFGILIVKFPELIKWKEVNTHTKERIFVAAPGPFFVGKDSWWFSCECWERPAFAAEMVWMSFLKRSLKANTQFGRVSPCLQTRLFGVNTDAKKMCLTAWLK